MDAVRSHPDRCAVTLATLPAARQRQGPGPYAPPGAGARDCRIDLKLLQWRALAASARSAAARDRLHEFEPGLRPDLWAGTVQDGVARGFAAALEEAIDLGSVPGPGPRPVDPTRAQVFVGTALHRKKDLLVKSSGPRVRFSRKEGVLFVDRETDRHLVDCLQFEARSDRGTLDGFGADEAERPRVFSARFLQPAHYSTGDDDDCLVLEGRLGRTRAGFPCRVTIQGTTGQPRLLLRIAVENRHRDHRLRLRFVGMPPELVEHECTDVREVIADDRVGQLAFTLVRACERLLVDGRPVAAQAGAQCAGWIEHRFWLGRRQASRGPSGPPGTH
jgi:hypothetical protein